MRRELAAQRCDQRGGVGARGFGRGAGPYHAVFGDGAAARAKRTLKALDRTSRRRY